MGMSLVPKTTTYSPSENQEWLGSAHGTQSMDSINLDAALCVAKFATGIVPSGIPLKRQGSGLYAPAIDNGAGVDDVPDYHLFTTVDLTAGGAVTPAAAANTPASGLWTGEIIVAKIPAYALPTLLVANTTVGLFRYV